LVADIIAIDARHRALLGSSERYLQLQTPLCASLLIVKQKNKSGFPRPDCASRRLEKEEIDVAGQAQPRLLSTQVAIRTPMLQESRSREECPSGAGHDKPLPTSVIDDRAELER
jgi:hypothetical protein